MHRAYDNLRPREGNEASCLREKGETGLPFLDACMRSLQATGWLNFRMRAMVMSVASYHLWLDWRAAGTRLGRLFTDYEPGIHWSQVQMQSGITGMNSIRIYNPMKQAVEHDPNGAFVRRWCPELRDVPDVFLHEPWKWDDGKNPLEKPIPPAWLISKPVHVPPVIVFGRFAKIVQTGPKPQKSSKSTQAAKRQPAGAGSHQKAR